MKLPDLAVLNHKRSKGRSKMGLEGIVSKRLGSTYRSGRSPAFRDDALKPQLAARGFVARVRQGVAATNNRVSHTMPSGDRRWLQPFPDTLLLLWLLLGDANGRCFFNSLVHFLGGQQRSDSYARVSSHIGAQLRGCCRDFVGIADN